MNVAAKMSDMLREREWSAYKRSRRRRLRNEDFTIIASNCSGMFMYYDLGLQYRTPTINLSIEMNDFVKMVRNLRWYMGQEMTEFREEHQKCPVGVLGDIQINFIHYNSFQEGVRKWEERKKRINWDNLFIVGSEKDGCTYETIREFDKLPYQNKVIFTHIAYPEFQSAYYIKGFEEAKELGTISNYRMQRRKRRYLDAFDYVDWLNSRKGVKA